MNHTFAARLAAAAALAALGITAQAGDASVRGAGTKDSGVAAEAPARRTVKVIVHTAKDSSMEGDIERSRTSVGRVGKLVTERQNFDIYEVPEDQLDQVANQPGVEIARDFDRIALRTGELDTQAMRRSGSTYTATRGLKLVQFSAPPSKLDRDLVLNQGVKIVDYVPSNAFLVWANSSQEANNLGYLTIIPNTPVQFIGDFTPQYVLGDQGRADFYRYADALNVPELPYNVQVANEGTAGTDAYSWASSAGLSPEQSFTSGAGRYTNFVAYVANETELVNLAARPGVVSVMPAGYLFLAGESSAQIIANRTSDSSSDFGQTGSPGTESPAAPGALPYATWLWRRMNKASSGTGYDRPSDHPIVGVLDTGVDNGTATGAASDADLNASVTVTRIVSSFLFNSSTQNIEQDDDQADAGGHGHFVASLLGGNNTLTGAANEDTLGFNYGSGINPYVRMINAKIASPFQTTSTLPAAKYQDILREVFSRAMLENDREEATDRWSGTARTRNRALITTNSWGIVGGPGFIPNDYDVWAQMADYLVRDAAQEIKITPAPSDPNYLQRNAPGFQQQLSVVAVGNAGTAAAVPFRYGEIFSPGLAKNVLSVGGSEDDYDSTATTCNVGSEVGDSGQDMMYIPPGFTWPGGPVLTDGFATSIGCRVGFCGIAAGDEPRIKPDLVAPAISVRGGSFSSPACAIPGTTKYQSSAGTSFSTPQVAGAASLAATWLRRHMGIESPSPALLKAMLINSAKFLRGSRTFDPAYSSVPEAVPSPHQGFGRVNLDIVLEDTTPVFVVNQEVVLRADGASFVLDGTVADPTKPVRATLVWTDHPASTATHTWKNLTNDLDLTMTLLHPSVPANNRIAYGNDMIPVAAGNGYGGNVSVLHSTTAGTQYDRRNNVEQVMVDVPVAAGQLGWTPSSVRVTVSPFSVGWDALAPVINGGPGFGRQDFALVVYNFVPATPASMRLQTIQPGTASDFRDWILINNTPGYTPSPAITNGTGAPPGTTSLQLSSTASGTPGGYAAWGAVTMANPRDFAPVRMRANVTTNATAGNSNFMRFRFGTSSFGDSGYTEVSWLPNAPNAPVGTQDLNIWHVPRATSDFGVLDEMAVFMDLVDSSASAGHFIRLNSMLIDQYDRAKMASATVLYNRGGTITGSEAAFAPTGQSPFSASSTPGIAGWGQNGSADYTGSTSKTFQVFTGSQSRIEMTTGSQSASNTYLFAASEFQPFTLQNNFVYVVDVYIRADSMGSTGRPPLLRARWLPTDFSGTMLSVFDLDRMATGLPTGVNTAGLTPGGATRRYSFAYQPKLTGTQVLTSVQHYLFIELLDNSSARDTQGRYTIQRVVVTRYTP
jgi:hypothetical protein